MQFCIIDDGTTFKSTVCYCSKKYCIKSWFVVGSEKVTNWKSLFNRGITIVKEHILVKHSSPFVTDV